MGCKRLASIFLLSFLVCSVLPLTVMGAETLIDSYSETNQDTTRLLKEPHPSTSQWDRSAHGQLFNCTGDSYNLTSAKFYLSKVGSPIGYGNANLYEVTGSIPNAVPTGSPLAVSDAFDVSTLTGSLTLVTFTFSGNQRYGMTENSYYFIVYQNPSSGIDVNNYPVSGRDSSSPSHFGNEVAYINSAWVAGGSGVDAIFYVYGEVLGVGGQELSFPLFENINVLSSISKTMELSNTLFQNVNLWSSLTMNKEKGFSLFENILLFSSVNRGIELANILFESSQVWSSLTASIELSLLDLAFILFENTLMFPSLSRGIEISRSLSGTIRFWSSLAIATEGVARELAFILFESINPIISLITAIVEAPVYATKGFVLAAIWLTFFIGIIAICVYLGVKRH